MKTSAQKKSRGYLQQESMKRKGRDGSVKSSTGRCVGHRVTYMLCDKAKIKGAKLRYFMLSSVVLEKILESPLDCRANQIVDPRRSNQSILKEINPEHSLEGLMLKLQFQYLGHLMRRADSLEKTLMLGKIEGRSRRGRQRMR